MRGLVDRFKMEYSPIKAMMLLACVAVLVGTFVFIGSQVIKMGDAETENIDASSRVEVSGDYR